MNKDELLGTTKAIGGSVQQAASKMTGDTATQLKAASMEEEGRAEGLVGQARDMAGHAADAASTYAKDAYDKGQKVVRDSSRAINKQTGVDLNSLNWTSVLVGAAFGLMVGIVISRV